MIVCSGDSHTWGEGASGMDEAFQPPAQPGEARNAPFAPPCYVNLLRERLCSRFTELLPASLARHGVSGFTQEGELAWFSREMTLPFDGCFGRLQLRCSPEGGAAVLSVDGEETAAFDTYAAAPTYRWLPFWTADGAHTLHLRSAQPLALYRAEFFSGETAVLNSGVGSCPATRYLSDYWQSHVEQYHPSVVILEAHSINDWIQGTPIETYVRTLTAMVRRVRAAGGKPLLATVEPIAGDTYLGGKNFGPQFFGSSGIAYTAYIEATRAVAQAEQVPLADAYAAMAARLETYRDDAARYAALFHDNWHPNDLGHKLYAETILETLRKL